MGLRRKELLLKWTQVDFDLPTIAIIGKGGVPAILPLTHRAYEILWGLRGNDPMHVFTFVAQRTRRCPKTGREFVKGQRYPMTYYGIGTNRRRAWPKAGVDARLHDTRHHDRPADFAHHGQSTARPEAIAAHPDQHDREILHRHHLCRSAGRDGTRGIPEKVPDRNSNGV
jgi:hypothetical protein